MSSSSRSDSAEGNGKAEHIPTSDDVHEARAILKALNLPTELVLQILEDAYYFPVISRSNKQRLSLLDEDWSLESCSARICLFSASIPYSCKNEHVKVRNVKFQWKSQDQGWTSEPTKGTYNTSSWFEVSILRPFASEEGYTPLEEELGVAKQRFFTPTESQGIFNNLGWFLISRPEGQYDSERSHCPEMSAGNEGTHAWYLQGNLVANTRRDWDEYCISWSRDGQNDSLRIGQGSGKGEEFIESLQEGDVVAMWMRAKRRGWENHACEIKITITYDV